MNNRRDLNGELLTVKKDAPLAASSSSSTLLKGTAQLKHSCIPLKTALVQMHEPEKLGQAWGNEELIGNLLVTC